MINRITKIEGVGKFQSSTNIGGLHFGAHNLIFGENTLGKSTLSAIFKSLQTGDRSYVEGRRTFGISDQEIELYFDSSTCIKFSDPAWTKGIKEISIFNEDFISNNIHLGGQVVYENHKELNQIIIGEKGQEISKEINDLQVNIKKITQKKMTHGNIFTNRFPVQPVNLATFKKLANKVAVDEEIEKIKSNITDVKNQEVIGRTCLQIENILDRFPKDYLRTELEKSFSVDRQAIQKHVEANWKKDVNPQGFLQTGYQLLKADSNNCVFCGQEIKNHAIKLLEEYSKFFSEEFLSFQRKIGEAIESFNEWNIDSTMSQIRSLCGQIKLEIQIPSDLNDLKLSCHQEFSKKQADFSHAVDFEPFENLMSALEIVKTSYQAGKNQKLKKASESLSSLEEQLNLLEMTKIRHNENWDEYFEKKVLLDQEFKDLQLKREDKRKELEAYGASIFVKNHSTINAVLENLNADFRLDQFIPLKKIVGKDERIFSLVFYNHHKVSLESAERSEPNFKNTLSESDKRVLGFAFFISLLKNNPRLSEKIIILDDPFSSFDKERRRATIKEILNLSIKEESTGDLKHPKQIFILTHEIEFFKWCLVKFPDAISLKIINEGLKDGIKKSTLERVDKDNFLEDSTRRDLKEIINTIDSGKAPSNLEGLQIKCRKILEEIYGKKYFNHLEEDIKSKKSVRTFTETLNQKKINGFDKNPKFDSIIDLCNDLNIEMHSNEFSNEGDNGIDVLKDFQKVLEII